MRPGRTSFGDLAADLLAWSEAVERMAGRTSRQAIGNDEQAELALSRAVEIVGEVAGRLLSLFPERWNVEETRELKGAYRTCNRLAHGHDDVSSQIVFDIATQDVVRLRDMARAWPANLDAEP